LDREKNGATAGKASLKTDRILGRSVYPQRIRGIDEIRDGEKKSEGRTKRGVIGGLRSVCLRVWKKEENQQGKNRSWLDRKARGRVDCEGNPGSRDQAYPLFSKREGGREPERRSHNRRSAFGYNRT